MTSNLNHVAPYGATQPKAFIRPVATFLVKLDVFLVFSLKTLHFPCFAPNWPNKNALARRFCETEKKMAVQPVGEKPTLKGYHTPVKKGMVATCEATIPGTHVPVLKNAMNPMARGPLPLTICGMSFWTGRCPRALATVLHDGLHGTRSTWKSSNGSSWRSSLPQKQRTFIAGIF